MKQNAYIAGIGMTRFGKHLDRGLKSLAGEAICAALNDAGIDKSKLDAAYVGNAAAGIITGQVCIPGQSVLRELGIGKIPVVNMENACASSSSAFVQACSMITAGLHDVVLVVGMEKLYHCDKERIFSVFGGCIDKEDEAGVLAQLAENAKRNGAKVNLGEAGSSRSVFMDIYATMARDYMARSGATPEHFARVSVKNSKHGSLNPNAQFRKVLTVEEVLNAPLIADPLTLLMCSPICDGAAAIVLVSQKKAMELGLGQMVRVESALICSGWDYQPGDESVATYAAQKAYNAAGIGPQDLSCIELHDAAVPAELMYYEYLGLCGQGEGVVLLESGATALGGRIPVNTSGGLVRKGHPIGATGVAQIVELTEQLRGSAGARQVDDARIGLAENGGGYIGTDAAAMTMTILSI
ncbi:thiolase family protein [Pseudomonas sp. MPC6]|uniref:thiolase family protein n=1 Tax=unclassified Pseudomonas TaxID=196821 RepID=UPI001110AD5E|nr:thiolase family protein [Pseudomonas sp. MPC6]QCY09450.1 thiolase family protein [Pseudomonas sp. MPC6]